MDNSEIMDNNLLNVHNEANLGIDNLTVTFNNNSNNHNMHNNNNNNTNNNNTKTNHQRVIPIGLLITFLTFYLTALYMQRITVNGLSNTIQSKAKRPQEINNYVKSTSIKFDGGDDEEKKEKQQSKTAFLNCMHNKMDTDNDGKDDKDNHNDDIHYPKQTLINGKINDNQFNMNCMAKVKGQTSDNTSIRKHNISIKMKRDRSYRQHQQHQQQQHYYYQKFIRPTTITTTTTNTKSAEPIIYLFALIFIYLLIKAASDINEHYKTRNKSEKCMRRYSLQSYAQKHGRTDRRTSKESKDPNNTLKLKAKQQQQQQSQYLSSLRSLSCDQTEMVRSMAPKNWAFVKQAFLQKSARNTFDVTNVAATTIIQQQQQQLLLQQNSEQIRRYSIPAHLITTGRAASLDFIDITTMTNDLKQPQQSLQQRRVRMINRH